MLVEFDKLPDDSRLWVYQSNRPFSKSEIEFIAKSLTAFCQSWEAHGQPLATSFKIEYDQFVILAVNENVYGASGCSIDGSVRVLKSIQDEIGNDLLDRSVAFLLNEKVVLYSIAETKAQLTSGTISGDEITFNNSVSSKKEFLQNWKVSTKNSTWLAKYLPKKTLV
jgi:hypothetical protein